MEINEYTNLEDLKNDVKSIKIQGATNVAIATIKGLILHCSSIKYSNWEEFIQDINRIGMQLATLRNNEPLAKNAVKYIHYMIKTRYMDADTANKRREAFMTVANEFLEIISYSKKEILKHGRAHLYGLRNVFTHCHSSTTERLIVDLSRGIDDFKVVCTETRPRYQGRITATKLLQEGLDTTMIVDSAAEAYIIGRGLFPVDAVFLGADQISLNGDFINKVGSWGIALAAYYANVPVYIVTPFLKVDADTAYKPIIIERRDSEELWPEHPAGLNIDNPAFDLIDANLITGYITELGVITAQEIPSLIREKYGWVY